MPNGPRLVSGNPFEEPQRRMSEYTAKEIATLQARLDKKLGPEYISSRPGAMGQRVHYLSSDKCISLANEVFGFNGWSSSIQNIQIDFVEESQSTGKVSLGLSVIVRVTLKDGSYHEDIGYGHIENCKGKAAAFEKAKKEGTTDALKRALRNFGNVLGNCVYDKDYVSKVMKVKAVPAKWDIDCLHRHPDYITLKKEPAPQEQTWEDDNPLPGPPNPSKRENSDNTLGHDVDGEFGSDLFDEADFSVADAGNPDEITLEQETREPRQAPSPDNKCARRRSSQGMPIPRMPNLAVVTPSRPERSWTPTRSLQAATSSGLSHRAPEHRESSHADTSIAQNHAYLATVQPPEPRLNQNAVHQAAGGQQSLRPRSDKSHRNTTPSSSQSLDGHRQLDPPAAFFSARAADMLRDNPPPGLSGAPHFDPRTESPSIRKTAGVDHTKSIPISKPMLAGVASSPILARDFINPSSDINRKIGAPNSVGVGSPLNRSQTTSSYRPLTRPNIDTKAVGSVSAAPPPLNSASLLPSQNINGKRPPLSDVTNGASESDRSGPLSTVNIGDLKKPKFDERPATFAQVQHPRLPQQKQLGNV